MDTPTQSIDPAEELIRFIMTATTLSDEQKDLYIGELTEGRMHPDLVTGLDALCDAEAAAAEREAVMLEQELADANALAVQEEAAVLPELTTVLAEHEREIGQILADHTQACLGIERGMDKGVEGAVTAEEATEAEAIRAMLKKQDEQ